MKIPLSIRAAYQDARPTYDRLKEQVDALLIRSKNARWHYESRVKGEESFAQKIETGRVPDPSAMEDLFACTLVVENRSRVAEAEKLVTDTFELRQRRPPAGTKTHLSPWSFDFDDLRLYVAWRDDQSQRPTGLDGLVFEVQVKTFLQHAWGIATHDFIYKSDSVNWSGARIAYQVKAMLENAELSISEAKQLAASAMLNKEDTSHETLRATIAAFQQRWEADRLPSDLRRLAQTVEEVAGLLRLEMDDVWRALDRATEQGAGTKTLDLSPYGAILAALLAERGADLFAALPKARGRRAIFVPYEIELPPVPKEVAARLVRTKAAGGKAEAKLDVLIADGGKAEAKLDVLIADGGKAEAKPDAVITDGVDGVASPAKG